MIKPPPVMSPHEIEAVYAKYKGSGMTTINMKGKPITIDEWRGRELRRWATEQMKKDRP